jgi:hypothetical protein
MILVEDLPFVDVRDLAKYGAFAGGGREFRDISLRYPFLSRLRSYRYRVDLRMRGCQAWTFFPVEWTRCNYGGGRPWFRCTCGKRVARLYCGGLFIGCRSCYSARYESQRLGDERARAYRQACKIRLSLGGEPSIRGPFPERPYRMWRKKYERLKQEAERLEARLRRSRYAKRAPDYEKFSFF